MFFLGLPNIRGLKKTGIKQAGISAMDAGSVLPRAMSRRSWRFSQADIATTKEFHSP
jgi:hypothetical protein